MPSKNINVKKIESKYCAAVSPWDGEEYKVRVPVYGITAFGILFAPEYRPVLTDLCAEKDIFDIYGFENDESTENLVHALLCEYTDQSPLVYCDSDLATLYVPPMHPFLGAAFGMKITPEIEEHVFDEFLARLDLACKMNHLPCPSNDSRTPKWFLYDFYLCG